jgi:hypothetical protein
LKIFGFFILLRDIFVIFLCVDASSSKNIITADGLAFILAFFSDPFELFHIDKVDLGHILHVYERIRLNQFEASAYCL